MLAQKHKRSINMLHGIFDEQINVEKCRRMYKVLAPRICAFGFPGMTSNHLLNRLSVVLVVFFLFFLVWLRCFVESPLEMSSMVIGLKGVSWE